MPKPPTSIAYWEEALKEAETTLDSFLNEGYSQDLCDDARNRVLICKDMIERIKRAKRRTSRIQKKPIVFRGE